mmetsp:Transcript_61119/g.133857  ORF Transcript_61119/g.133857 Transcript_61119/m.133857 type:complete len:217 (-) Transcript_61119:503-1153(-)
MAFDGNHQQCLRVIIAQIRETTGPTVRICPVLHQDLQHVQITSQDCTHHAGHATFLLHCRLHVWKIKILQESIEVPLFLLLIQQGRTTGQIETIFSERPRFSQVLDLGFQGHLAKFDYHRTVTFNSKEAVGNGVLLPVQGENVQRFVGRKYHDHTGVPPVGQQATPKLCPTPSSGQPRHIVARETSVTMNLFGDQSNKQIASFYIGRNTLNCQGRI